jgi:integrase
VKGHEEIRSGHLTFAGLCELYLERHTPSKVATSQAADHRCVELWCRVVGANSDPHAISSEQWRRFIRDRTSGAIDSRGCAVGADARRPVRARTVEADLIFLQLLLNWGVNEREGDRYLLRENCARGYSVPTEKNPRRAVATVERYEALRKAAQRVTMRLPGTDRCVPSYLPDVLDLCEATGHRLTAVCSLHYEDFRLSEGPFGTILWRAETSKNGEESVTAMDEKIRRVVDRILAARPGIGPVPLFPSLKDSTKPIDRDDADRWLRKAEKDAKLAHLPGTLWHSLRRKWSSEMQFEPPTVVAAPGGWKTIAVMQRAYQHANVEMMADVLSRRREYREARR